MRSIAICVLAAAVAACAPRPGQAILPNSAGYDDPAAWDACQAKTAASPEYRALKDKIGAHATLAMKTNGDRATPQEVAQIMVLHRDYVVPCRKIERESAARSHPALAVIMDSAYAKSDSNFSRLVTYQITWGEFTRDSETIKADMEAELVAAQILLEQQRAITTLSR